MKKYDNIEKFLCCIRNRLNVALLMRIIQWAMLGTGFGLVAAASCFLLRGRHVPAGVYFLALVLSLCGIFLSWVLRRFDITQAGQFADNFFKLHDGVISFISFHRQGKKGGFYELQASQLEKEIAKINTVKAIPLGLSKRMFVLATMLVFSALLIGFVDDSEAFKQETLTKEQTLSKTTQINEELEKELDKVIKDLEEEKAEDAEIKKQIDELKELVKELEVTEDQKKALSQYAKIECKLYAMLNSAQQRKDELLLDRVGDKLKSIKDGRQLGNKLSQKDYKAAADELKNLKLNPEQKESEEAKNELAKLKSISQQMASAASSSLCESPSQEGQSSQSCSNEQKSGSQNDSGKSQSDQTGQSLARQMFDLNKSVEDYQKNQCQSGCENCNKELDNLGQSLSRLGSKRSMQQKMQSLCQKLGQCQSSMCNSQSQCASDKAGGKEAGIGSIDSRTNKVTPDIDNGNIQSLQGLKNSGPSDVTTEEADSGSGVSSQNRANRQLEYRKQAEAYVQRQDIPAEVKQGVKHYFENIHTNY